MIIGSIPAAGNSFERVRKIMARVFQIDASEIKPETLLFEDFSAYHLREIELVTHLEDAFGIDITDQEAQKTKTVGDLTRLIESKLA